MPILRLRGSTALSAFRRAKLDTALQALDPSLTVAASAFWHFVEVERAPDASERALLDRLLRYGDAAGDPPRDTALYLVTPRLGTISPWSSKATDIARNCGLALRAPGRARDRSPRRGRRRRPRPDRGPAARPDDRDGARPDRGRRRAVPPFDAAPARAGAGARRRARGARARERRAGARALRRRDRLPRRRLHPPRTRPDRRRADDVRAGELGALPAQDLQRVLDRRRRSAPSTRCSG